MGKASTYYTGLPSWAKGFLAVAAVAGVGAMVYLLYKKSKQVDEDKPNKIENKAAESELVDEIKKGVKPTYPKSQYDSYANSVHQAMNGSGTDEDLIKRVFANLKNNADFLALTSAYGTRTVDGGTFAADYKGTLSGSLASELSNDDIRDINASMQRKGITYKF
jgi:hypothetical protein